LSCSHLINLDMSAMGWQDSHDETTHGHEIVNSVKHSSCIVDDFKSRVQITES